MFASRPSHALTAAALFAAAVFALGGCNRTPRFHGQDVTGQMPDLAFELTDSQGRRTTAEPYLGKVTLLYFGFTHCPDMCPTTLSQIGQALAALGDAADEVQVLLVTVDPDRDTPRAMQRYTRSFGPWLHGFTGSKKELRALNQAYKVDFLAQEPGMSGEYDVMHSNRVFGFDADGRCRVLLPDTADTEAIVADLRQLLAL